MSKPLIVSIPHRLGREEAARRIKSGFSAARANCSTFVTFHEEAWTGDRLAFNVSALGQTASDVLDVADDHVVWKSRCPGCSPRSRRSSRRRSARRPR
jgi:hypothetical protein